MRKRLNPIVAAVIIVLVLAVAATVIWSKTGRKIMGNSPGRAGQGMKQGPAPAPPQDEAPETSTGDAPR